MRRNFLHDDKISYKLLERSKVFFFYYYFLMVFGHRAIIVFACVLCCTYASAWCAQSGYVARACSVLARAVDGWCLYIAHACVHVCSRASMNVSMWITSFVLSIPTLHVLVYPGGSTIFFHFDGWTKGRLEMLLRVKI